MTCDEFKSGLRALGLNDVQLGELIARFDRRNTGLYVCALAAALCVGSWRFCVTLCTLFSEPLCGGRLHWRRRTSPC